MTDFASLLETRSAVLADVDLSPGAGERLLVLSDLTGTMQLYELEADGGLRRWTDLPEPVGTARYVPGERRAVVAVDRGGDERHQLYLVDLVAPPGSGPLGFDDLAVLTNEPDYAHHLAGISPDGTLCAYVSNKANGVDFDLWVCELSRGEHRLVHAAGGWCQPGSGFSPDGSWVSILLPGRRPLDEDLLLVEVATGEVRVVLPHPDEGSAVGAPAWVDARRFYVSSNVGSDHAAVVLYDLDEGSAAAPADTGARLGAVGTGDLWDAGPVTSGDGRSLLVIENRNGASHMTLAASDGPDASSSPTEIALEEPGVVESHLFRGPVFSRDGSHIYYTLSSPRLAGDVWAWDLDSGETRRLTLSPAKVAPAELVSAEVTETTSFDGERVPLFTYRPRSKASRPPVVVYVHGGPESQSVLSFNPVVQGLVAAGYAVVVPNVRGSTGYGKLFAGLDDTTRRLDSVRDLGAVHDWLEQAGLDAGRAALWGGSYGGYMVLAGLAFQPELWAAGVDIVGMSDLVTFLENTSDYRRAHREREYGSLRHDREFLAAASPLRHVEAMRAPLFVIHGRNDPRVPVSEAEQLVASLRGRGVRCELVVYEDEGHGLARLANRLDAYPRAVRFLDEVLKA
jgi:dipeptidyl aminopeptidase/acylaminoacyl peptidase